MLDREVRLYIEHAREMLQVTAHNIEDGFYGSAVNRAYYAIFYAASALLVTRGLARSKHASVLAAFRQHFVKSGEIEVVYAEIYGRVMDDRHMSDYDVEASIEVERASTDVKDAGRFVDRLEHYLNEEGWL
jgi:uncharacterized protein (UPF0332 family)